MAHTRQCPDSPDLTPEEEEAMKHPRTPTIQVFCPDSDDEIDPRDYSFSPEAQPHWAIRYPTLALALPALHETVQWALSVGFTRFTVIWNHDDDGAGAYHIDVVAN